MRSLLDLSAGSAVHTSAPLERPQAPGERLPLLTVWVAQSSAELALDVAERLRGLDVAVRFWDDSAASMPLTTNSRSDDSAPNGVPVAPVWRGGLAPGALRRVREHIESSLSERIELGELARITGLSECHFSRAFRQSVGVPPHRYVMTRRVEVAANLIEQTNRSLTDIALAVGFADHSHFTRTFARMKRETPGAYRRRHR
jgi:transcriptional regulator GlxA family with amidase domain